MRRRLALLILLAWASLQGAPRVARDDLDLLQVKVWSQAQGLPGTLNTLARTRDGYLWIGTYEGLYRFDGVRFTLFNQANTPAFTSDRVRALLADEGGGLWIGLPGTLVRLDSEGFRSIPVPLLNINDSIHRLLLDPKGALWVLSGVGALLRFEGGTFTRVDKPGEILGGGTSRMALTAGGEVVVASPHGLMEATSTSLRPYARSPLPAGTPALGVATQADGTLWVADDRALYGVTSGGARRISAKEGLPFAPLNVLIPDGWGALWLSTPNGAIARFDGQRFEIPRALAGKQSLLTGLLTDPEGSTWVATSQHGLLQLSPEAWITRGAPEGFPERVDALLPGRRGGFWMGSLGQGLWHQGGGPLQPPGPIQDLHDAAVISLAEGPDGDLWVGTYTAQYRVHEGKATRVVSPLTEAPAAVRAIFWDTRGRRWTAVDGRGIERWDRGQTQTYGPPRGQPFRIPYGFTETSDGTVWAATLDGFLVSFRGEEVRVFDQKDGVPPSFTVLPAAEGGLWLGGPGGLAYFQEGRCRILGPKEGFQPGPAFNLLYDAQGHLVVRSQMDIWSYPAPDLKAFLAGRLPRVHGVAHGKLEGLSSTTGPGAPGAFLAPDGTLAMGSIRGVVFRPPQPPLANRTPPTVVVEGLLADGRNVRGGPLRWEGGNLEVEYTATSYLNPDKVRFRYRLEGFDPGWVEAGTRRKAFYTQVPPGRYTFRVQACNDAGLWNEAGASVSFRLRPRWYQAWWFRGMGGVVLAALAWLGVRWRIRELREAKARLEATVEARTLDLQATAISLAAKNQELEEFDRIVKALNRELGLEALLNVLLRQIATQFPMAQRGMVLLRDPGADVFRVACLLGYSQEDEGLARHFEVPASEALSWYERTREQVQGGFYLVQDVTGIPGADRMRLRAPRSMLLMPLEHEGRLEGFLTLQNLEDESAFEAADGAKLLRFREHLLSALAKARTLEELAARERELRRSEERYQLVVEGANEGVFDVDLVHGGFYSSDRVAEFLGVPAEEMTADKWDGFVHPDDRKGIRDALVGHLRDHLPYDVEFRMRTRSGEYRWFRSRGQAKWGPDGRATRMGGSIGDITERKAADRQLLVAKEAAEKAQADLEARNRELEEMEAAVKALNRELDLGSLLRVFMEQIATQLPGAQRCLFLLRDAERGRYRVAGLRGYPPGDAEAMATLEIPESEMLPWYAQTQANQREEIVLARDIPSLPGAARSPLALPRAVLILPLEIEGHPEGFLALQHLEDPEAFAEADRAKLLRYREHLLSAVAKARTVQRLDAMVRDLAEVNQVAESARVVAEFEREDARKARREAEQASQAKSDFLANMSHEIRTPMNAVLGFAGLGSKADGLAKAQDYFRKIARAGESLLGILNDILDFSKVEAGKLELEAAPFSLAAVLDQVRTLFEQRAQEKGVALRVGALPDAPQDLVGDPLRLGQVLTNLVSNALKFTERGEVTLDVRVQAVAEGSVRLRFTVRDTGIGLSPEQQARLFQAFSQADSSTTRKFGGTGLGLTISQRLVALMGGEIQVESASGRGSTFSFEAAFPIGQPSSGAHRALRREEIQAQPAPSLAGARVLLAEDNPINQEVAREILQGFGLVVDTAHNGVEAVQRVDQAAYAAVLMDMQMPEMDGFEATARIREKPLHAGLPILAMTAHALPNYQEACLSAGMNDFVTKPIEPEALLAALLRWIPDRAPQPGGTPGGVDPSTVPPLPLLDRAGALRRLGGNAALLDHLFARFQEDHAGTAEALATALAVGDLARIEVLAHTLKGVAGNLGAVRVQQGAEPLEKAAQSLDWSAVQAALAPVARDLTDTLAALGAPPQDEGR